jgi:hypothetical protein
VRSTVSGAHYPWRMAGSEVKRSHHQCQRLQPQRLGSRSRLTRVTRRRSAGEWRVGADPRPMARMRDAVMRPSHPIASRGAVPVDPNRRGEARRLKNANLGTQNSEACSVLVKKRTESRKSRTAEHRTLKQGCGGCRVRSEFKNRTEQKPNCKHTSSQPRPPPAPRMGASAHRACRIARKARAFY